MSQPGPLIAKGIINLPKEVTSQFKTRKNHSGQVEGRALSCIQVFPSQFQGKTENPAEHRALCLCIGIPKPWGILLSH